MKKKDDIIKYYLKKKKLLNKHNKLYYDKDSPVVNDELYDDLKKEVAELEKKNIYLRKYSPTSNSVGFKPSSKFTKIKQLVNIYIW